MLQLLTSLGEHNLVATIIAAVIGLLCGSFLTVVIHRLPLMMQREADLYLALENGQHPPHTPTYNLLLPRSSCPHCATPIAMRHNIPLLSYLLLRGRCRACKTAISWLYPAVEVTTAVLSAWLVWRWGWSMTTVAALLLTYALITLTCIDAQTQLLPDSVTLPLLWLGLLVNLQGLFVQLSDAVLGAALGYVALWVIYWVFRLLTGKEGIGYGDFKLMAALGAWLGWQALPMTLLLASCLGAIAGLTMIALKKQTAQQAIPFGPYLAIAGWCMLMYGRHFLLLGINA